MCWFVVCLCLVAIQQIKLMNILPEFMFASLCSFVKSRYFFLGENLTVFLCFQDAGKAKETLVVAWIPSCLDPWHQPSCATWLKPALRHFKFLWASGRRRPRGVLGSRKHVGPNHVRPAEEKMFDQPSRKVKTKGEKSEPLVLNDPQSDARITGGKGKIWPGVGQNYTKWPRWESSCTPSFLVLVPGRRLRIALSALLVNTWLQRWFHMGRRHVDRQTKPTHTHMKTTSQPQITRRRSGHIAIIVT